MGRKLFNTYSVGEDLTLFEIDRRTISNKEYLLLLEKQEPNIICVGFFEEGKLQIVKNKPIASELLKIFTEDKDRFYKSIEPFVKPPKKA